MNVRGLIKKIPFCAQVKRKFIQTARDRSTKKLLTQLAGNRYHRAIQISQALILLQKHLPQEVTDWIGRIESERRRLLTLHEPLKDGSLGEGGPYDDRKSIREACLVSKPPKPALLLFLLTRTTDPQNVIELGTNVGISSAYIAAALKTAGQNGKISTLDASSYRQQVAKEIHCNLGIDNISYAEGLFSYTLSPTLADMGSVDLAFVDGHHQFQPTLDYFEEILKFSTPNTVFVFDDIRWSDGMKEAWECIRLDDRLGLIVDLFSVGICARRAQENPERFVSNPVDVFGTDNCCGGQQDFPRQQHCL